MQMAVLDLHQALGNVQAQAAALCVSGFIALHKALQQLLRTGLQLLPGHIFHSKLNHSAMLLQANKISK